jgi:hypothetical protein
MMGPEQKRLRTEQLSNAWSSPGPQVERLPEQAFELGDPGVAQILRQGQSKRIVQSKRRV